MPVFDEIESKFQGSKFEGKAYYPPVPIGEYQVEVALIEMIKAVTFDTRNLPDKDKIYEQILKVRLRVLDEGPYYGKLLFMRDMAVKFNLPSKKAGSRPSSLFCFVKAIEEGKKDGVHNWTEETIANFNQKLKANLNAYEGQEVEENGIKFRTGGAQLKVTTNIYKIVGGDNDGKKANGSVRADTCTGIDNFTYLPPYKMPAREVDPIFKMDDPKLVCSTPECNNVVHGWIANKGVKDKEKIVTQEMWYEAQAERYDGAAYCSDHYTGIKKEFGGAILNFG